MNSEMNKGFQKIVESEFPGFIKLLERCMNLERWGFRQTFYGVAQEFVPSVIYDSKACRVRFGWIPGDIRDGPDSAALSIQYGRLHASNQRKFMIWNGQECHCWHQFDHILFLDGLSPEEAVLKRYEIPSIEKQFVQLNKNQGHTWSNIEWTARKEAFVWEHYRNRLFDLFDLQHSDLWKRYSLFIKELYRLDPVPMKPGTPPPENIC